MSQNLYHFPKIRRTIKTHLWKPRKTRTCLVIFFGFLLLPWVAAFFCWFVFFFCETHFSGPQACTSGAVLPAGLGQNLSPPFGCLIHLYKKWGCFERNDGNTITFWKIWCETPIFISNEEMVVTYIVNLVVLKWKWYSIDCSDMLVKSGKITMTLLWIRWGYNSTNLPMIIRITSTFTT